MTQTEIEDIYNDIIDCLPLDSNVISEASDTAAMAVLERGIASARAETAAEVERLRGKVAGLRAAVSAYVTSDDEDRAAEFDAMVRALEASK